ncbi:hypothetical protein SAMN05444920_104578 [Nonomuraea solani]|uniref:Secreted protein n=1 Tax=Nonomuraea solani TaxID=1144553 RepID=A0A1H6CYQ0_9ACTN|nr:hypothetical protein [Nonomuraea solani]SEG78191.1 hypothetical protein SAMN05444920_104578 [Nonomuraea solani]
MALRPRLIRPVLALCTALAATATVLTPAAHADTYRTATSSGWGPNWSAGAANAEANARAELNRQAAQAGEVCPNVTTSSTHVYTAPDGSAYVFQGTASGTCVPQPPAPTYPVPRTETRQAGGATSSAAIQAGHQAARAAILAVGVSCTGWTTTSNLVWAAPGSVWYIYDVTVSANCTN